MKIQLDKFLAITALIAGSAAAGQACTSNSPKSSGSNGSGGSGNSGGSGGDGGTTADGGTGGEATTTSSGGTGEGGEAGDNGGAGDTGDAGAAGDGGTGGEMGEEFCEAPWPSAEACEALSFAATLCDGDTRSTDGYVMCNSAAAQYNADVLDAIIDCLEDIGGDPCDEGVHGAASFACLSDVPDSGDLCTTQTAADFCSEIECSALEEGECEALLSRYPDGTIEGDPAVTAVECFRASETALGVDDPSCADNLLGCL